MYGECLKNCKNTFGAVIIVVLVIGAVWLAVDISNKLKGGRYIGRDLLGNTITVSGTGEIFAKPDLALTNFSLITEAKTVAQALSENSQRMNRVIDFLKEQGVEAKDLKTINFNISPRYEYQRVETEIYPYPPGKRVLAGYEVSQSLQVKIRDLAKLGQIIEGAAARGANQIGDLLFAIDKEDELKAEARKQAIEKAKAKAKELTDSLGIRLGRITNFSESQLGPIFFGLEKAAAPQIEPGENRIELQVSITYEIN